MGGAGARAQVRERLTAEDRRSPEAALACEELATQLSRNLQRVAMLEGTIHSQRDSNQAVGYVGAVLFPPLMVIGTQHAIEEKAELDQLQEHRDRLRRVQASKSCPAS